MLDLAGEIATRIYIDVVSEHSERLLVAGVGILLPWATEVPDIVAAAVVAAVLQPLGDAVRRGKVKTMEELEKWFAYGSKEEANDV